MPLPFRDFHIITLLSSWDTRYPLDLLIARYFKENKALGSKDRGYIATQLYTLVRWQGLIDYFMTAPESWEKRLEILKTLNIPECLSNEAIPLHTRYSFPSVFFSHLEENFGIEQTKEFCLISNQQAPTTIRANVLKTTRDALLKTLAVQYDVKPCFRGSLGIQFANRLPLYGTPEYKQGLFEVQDEGSQLVADLVNPKMGDTVLDFCAGSGGKSLAIAPKLEGKGQLYLHDIRENTLLSAKVRLKRAGVQNAQLVFPNSKSLQSIKKKIDWVLVDAPCSGSGTLRRNPEAKWRFSLEDLSTYRGKQRTIFEQALSFVKPGGHIVYMTCSVFPEENENQLAHFLQTYPFLSLSSPPLRLWPQEDGMDGFYGVVLRVRPPTEIQN